MFKYLKRAWAVVNLEKIDFNYSQIKNRLNKDTMIMGVVKADAYGHGDKFIADRLVKLGISWFGVSNLEEALSLRENGIYHPILVFGFTPAENAVTLSQYNITQTVYSYDYACKLNEAAKAGGFSVGIHIKIDTGMSRIGVVFNEDNVDETINETAQIYSLSNLCAEGIYTHFACADEDEEDSVRFTRGQYAKLCTVIKSLEEKNITFKIKHCCNSGGVINYPEMQMDMVRPGIIMYGLSPSRDCEGKLPLKPAMDLLSCISMVKDIKKGTSVSYGRRYTAHRDMKVATVPIGYADGIERELTNKLRMLVKGRYATVIGRVCMDQLMLDVTHIEDVKQGDTVTIVGCDGEGLLTFDEMAMLSGSISYEKICLIGKRVPRIYRCNGKDMGVVDYILGNSAY